MLKNNTKRTEGFTIIEVLIVLAIAGLILLIVFLAVPALQRNSRNTQVKNGAASVLGAVNEYVNSNNGALPTGGSISPTDGTITITGAGTQASGKTQGGYTLNFAGTVPTQPGVFSVALNRKCNGNALATGNTPRAVAILYAVETSGTAVAGQCTET